MYSAHLPPLNNMIPKQKKKPFRIPFYFIYFNFGRPAWEQIKVRLQISITGKA